MFVFCKIPLQRTFLGVFLTIIFCHVHAAVFVSNKGQWNPQALYQYKTFHKDIWITASGFRSSIYDVQRTDQNKPLEISTSTPVKMEVFDVSFRKSHANAQMIEESIEPYSFHYIQSKGVFTISPAKKLIQKDVYKGIDVLYYTNANQAFEYDFMVHPGADPNTIQIEINGIEHYDLDKDGNLVLHSQLFGDLIQDKPKAYQVIDRKTMPVPIRYVLKNGVLSFSVTSYQSNYPLVIDPSLKYSTFLYCPACEDLAADNDINPVGEVAVTGITQNNNFPTTVGAFKTTLGNANGINYDAYVSKLNATGSNLIFSTFIGGNSQDISYGISYDNSGNIIITGKTTSSNFPINNALNTTYQGGYDGFLTKINPTGNSLVFSTFIGGNSFDECKSVTVDRFNQIYLAGNTMSTNLPISTGAFKSTLSPPIAGILYADGFVMKLNPLATAVSFCTLLGGNNDDYMKQIEVDSFGNSYVIGNTTSSNFQTVNAYDNTFNGDIDGFLTKINSTGTALVYSTYIGGTLKDYVQAISIDRFKNVYIAGNTYSTNFPIVLPAFKSAFSNSGSDIFVSQFDSTGVVLKNSTYLGSGFLNGLAINDCGYVFLSGFSFDANFPITADAMQKTLTGIDNIVTVMDSSLKTLAYSSFIGGAESDYGSAKISLLNNVFYYSGSTHSMNFPTTAGAFQTVKSNINSTPFVTAIKDMCFLPDPINITLSPNTFCLNQPVNAILKAKPVTNLCSSNNLSIKWYKNLNRTTPIAVGDSVQVLINPLDSYYVISYDNVYNCKSRDIKLITNTSNIVYNKNFIICKGDSIFLAKAWRKTGGMWHDTIIAAPCDSIFKITLVVNNPPYKKVNIDRCEGSPFVLNSKVYNVDGTYIDTLKSPAGCDSIVEFTLKFIPNSRTDTIKICVGKTYKVGTKTYSVSGVYHDTLTNSVGCDSIIHTHLFVTNNKVYYVTKTLCSNQSYQVGPNLYTTSGTYIDTFHLAGSCDSIIVSTLTFNLAKQFQDTVTACEGDTITLFGEKKLALLSLNGFKTKDYPNCTTKITFVNIKPKVFIINYFVVKCDNSGFKVGNRTYYTSGVYLDTLKQVNGCDSIMETTLTIIPKPNPVVVNYPKTICSGKTFTFNSKTYTTAGTYSDTLRNKGGCDSAYVNIILTVVNGSYKYIDTTLCNGQYITIGTKNRWAAGLYKDTLPSFFGCDSVIELNLHINPTKNTTIKDTFCQGKTFLFNGIYRTTGGTYYDTLKTYLNCDSFITLNLYMKPTKFTNKSFIICNGDSILISGKYRKIAGNYNDTLVAFGGCDSIVVNTLNLKPTYNINKNVIICTGDSYKVGSKTYTATGLYHDTLVSSLLCDSIIHTNLSVVGTIFFNRSLGFCSGDSFFVQKKFQKTTGTYYDTTKTFLNCDSVIVTTLTFYPKYAQIKTKYICLGDSALLGGAYRKVTGAYKDTFKSINLCDSIITTVLYVNNPGYKTINANICSNQFYFAGKQFRNTTGTYYDTFKTNFGCDSFVTTNLTVYPTFFKNNKVNLCQGLSYFAGGKLQTTSGNYVDTFKTFKGCDSIVQTDLFFYPTQSNLSTVSICVGERYFFQGAYYDKAGSYRKNYLNSYGCDSSFQLDLTILKSKKSTAYQKVCYGDTLWLNNKPYTKWGTYFDTLQTTTGCDSIVEIKIENYSGFNESKVFKLCEGDSVLVGNGYKKASGYYQDTLNTVNGCDSIILSKVIVENCDSTLKPIIPTAFTPNDDGVNDLFRPVVPSDKIVLIEMSIYDRWGNKVFDSNQSAQFYWDGRYLGSNPAMGVYSWFVTYKSNNKLYHLQGNVTLVI